MTNPVQSGDLGASADADTHRVAETPVVADLLEALKELVEFRDAEVDPGESTWAKVEAAIRKATRETQ